MQDAERTIRLQERAQKLHGFVNYWLHKPASREHRVHVAQSANCHLLKKAHNAQSLNSDCPNDISSEGISQLGKKSDQSCKNLQYWCHPSDFLITISEQKDGAMLNIDLNLTPLDSESSTYKPSSGTDSASSPETNKGYMHLSEDKFRSHRNAERINHCFWIISRFRPKLANGINMTQPESSRVLDNK